MVGTTQDPPTTRNAGGGVDLWDVLPRLSGGDPLDTRLAQAEGMRDRGDRLPLEPVPMTDLEHDLLGRPPVPASAGLARGHVAAPGCRRGPRNVMRPRLRS